MSRQLRLVNQRNCEILVRDAALAVQVDNRLVSAEPEAPGAFARVDLFRGAHIGPESIRYWRRAALAISDTRRCRARASRAAFARLGARAGRTPRIVSIAPERFGEGARISSVPAGAFCRNAG